MGKYYSVKDIVKKVKKDFGIDASIDDLSLIRKIQRILKNVDEVANKGRTFLYTSEQVDRYVYSSENVKYFAETSNKEPKEKFKRIKKDTYYKDLTSKKIAEIEQGSIDLVDKVNLSLEEFLEINSTNVKEKTYLTIDELKYLNKSGIVRIDSLTDEESQLVNEYQYQEIQSVEQQKKYLERLSQKKLQIMIEVLFNAAGFKLDEEKLSKDIQNEILNDEVLPDEEIEKSLERLKYSDNYYEEL